MPEKHTIQLSITKPCTQGWDNMTPNEKGRHCDSCNKTVVDFTLFTDRQIIGFFEKAKGKICGNFTNFQLQRQLVYTEPQNHFLYKLLFGTAIAVGFAGSAHASYNPNQISLVEQYIGNQEKVPEVDAGKDSIKVRVVGYYGEQHLVYASVVLFYNNREVDAGLTDQHGFVYFTRSKQYDIDKLSLRVVYAGYRDSAISKVSPDMIVKLERDDKFVSKFVEPNVRGDVMYIPDENYIYSKIVDASTGRALVNARVQLLWNDKEYTFGVTDSKGEVALAYNVNLAGYQFIMHIAADGYMPYEKEVDAKQYHKNNSVVSIKLKPAKK